NVFNAASASYLATITGTLTNAKFDSNVVSGSSIAINFAGSGTPLFSLINNTFSTTYGVLCNSACNVAAMGNTFNGLTGGVLRVNGSISVNYNLFGNNLTGGSIPQSVGSGSPTITSTICDLAGHCTLSPVTLSSLGAASSSNAGQIAMVSDSTA